jgi:mono/diheme cytochrome c family protein
MRTLALLILIVIVLVGAGVYFYVRSTGVSALQPPGMVEQYFATHTKDWLIQRAASAPLPPENPPTADNATEGHTQYGSMCAGCHGYDGWTPTRQGASMSPRAPSLAGNGAQRYSDAELYVIIHDGIRMSGMPGFGNTISSDQVWDLVHYIRTLPAAGH